MQPLGKRIRAERQRLGITLREFARRIGVSPPHVTDIETDRRRPSPELLARIAEQLGVSLAELEALDSRLRPDVKEWIEDQPGMSQLLRRIKDNPDLVRKVERLVERATKEKK